MTLAAGSRLGPYEIQSALGAGGMGEVYRARDSRLDRIVAIKVLPSHLSDRDDLRERFEREARVVSSLNHPHICTLHDIGDAPNPDAPASSLRFLVMEYLEGETLEERLRKGPLPLQQALRFAIEIADALDKAHRQGVTHRDLKPGNIMLTKAGAKLLDFGLAKQAVIGAGGLSATRTVEQVPADISGLKTQSAPLTTEGTILGTFQYMSPEQLEGLEADARSDIWAYGCVLYEMLTGKKAFEGRSQSNLIAAVIHIDPPAASVVQPMTPPALDRIIRVCLAKDPDERWQTAHDLGLQLQWVGEGGSAVGVPAPVAARRRSRERVAWVVAGVAALAALGLAIPAGRALRPAPPEDSARFLIETGVMPNPYLITVSPDGRKVAFVAVVDGSTQLFVRPIDAVEARPLPGTDGAIQPFWSPDSRDIAFTSVATNGGIKRVDATGGPSQLLVNLMADGGGTWSSDGVIVFSSRGSLYRVAATGGVPDRISSPDPKLLEVQHLWPHFLPDGRQFLYFARSERAIENRAIYAGALGSDQKIRIAQEQSMPVFAPPGRLLFHREGTLFAQPFDVSGLKLTGEIVRLAEGVPFNPANGRAAFAASSTGVLAYRSGQNEGLRQLAWFDRDGGQLELVGPPGPYGSVTLSPDEKRIAFTRADAGTASDIWTLEFATGILSRLTSDTSAETEPVWSSDSQTVVFASSRKGSYRVFQRTLGSREDEELFVAQSGSAWPDDMSRDGRFMLVNDRNTAILALPATGERKPVASFEPKAFVDESRFSPDGRWVAYASVESGTPEIYVAAFPGFTNIRQVSAGGGNDPRWRPDGKELFYLTSDGQLKVVGVTMIGSRLETTAPKTLFTTRVATTTPGSDTYAVSADGRRFLVLNQVQESKPTPTTVVLNWTAAIGK